ncbi:MAG: aminotransferase class I/II-fold pyridoxal phosphate-dependent enzyme [Gammaproteobacteria bacterium]|nr:aminotransferase class I/II-fold pyridoxal phosphate-dependent enzyme [Gammaproteobacteria bacterium]
MSSTKRIFKSHLYEMAAYDPPLSGRSVDEHLLLDFNERTLPVSDAVVDALVAYCRSGALQKYPDYGDIVARVAHYVGVAPDQLMICNGSDQGIDVIIRACLDAGDEAIIPGPSFAMYHQCAGVQNARILEPGYSIEGGYPTQEVLDTIGPRTRLVVVPLPNNPSGTPIDLADLERIAQHAPDAVILVDECYYEYTGLSAVGLIERYPNLVITRTFSKTWGMPSLRFGFVVSQAFNIDQLIKIRGPYDVNQLAVVAAGAALAEPDYTRSYVREVMSEAKPRLEGWLRQQGWEFWPSVANYLWVFPEHAEQVAAALTRANILIRPKRDEAGRLGLRITIGTSAQTERLIEVLASTR